MTAVVDVEKRLDRAVAGCWTDELIQAHEVRLPRCACLLLLRPIWAADVALLASRRRRFDPPSDLNPLTGRNPT